VESSQQAEQDSCTFATDSTGLFSPLQLLPPKKKATKEEDYPKLLLLYPQEYLTMRHLIQHVHITD